MLPFVGQTSLIQTDQQFLKLGSGYHLRIMARLIEGLISALSLEMFIGVVLPKVTEGILASVKQEKTNTVKTNNFSLETKLFWGDTKYTLSWTVPTIASWQCDVKRAPQLEIYYCSRTISLLITEELEIIKQISFPIHSSITGLLFVRAYSVHMF